MIATKHKIVVVVANIAGQHDDYFSKNVLHVNVSTVLDGGLYSRIKLGPNLSGKLDIYQHSEMIVTSRLRRCLHTLGLT